MEINANEIASIVRSVLNGMENGGAARLLVRKYIRGGVTLAAACMDWRICFD